MSTNKKSLVNNPLVIVLIGVLVGSLGTASFYQPQIKKLEQINESSTLEVNTLNSEISSLKIQVSENNLTIHQLEEHKKVFYGDITAQQAYRFLNITGTIILLDVRMETEYNSTHIEGALNIPLYQLEERINEIDKRNEVIVYCKSGYRSTKAVKVLIDHGYEMVYNLIYGIDDWRINNYPVQEGEGCIPCRIARSPV